jgi:hypothetical protein
VRSGLRVTRKAKLVGRDSDNVFRRVFHHVGDYGLGLIRPSGNTDYAERYFVRCEVTEEFPFLATKMSPYYDQ